MNLTVDVVFYDTTTASFAIDFEDADEPLEETSSQQSALPQPPEASANHPAPGLRKRGRGKEGTWDVQIVVALAVTREGLPVRSWVLPGNTTDVTTIEKVKAELRGWKLGRCLFVADAGMDSEENRKLLSVGGGKYLLAVRAASVKEVHEEVLTRAGRYKKVAENLRVKEVEVGDGELRRRYFVCYNPNEAERQKRHRDAVLVELHEEMGRHRDWNAQAKWAVALLASERTKRYLSVSPAGQVYVDTLKAKRAEKFDGKWVLITNDDTLKPEDAASGYKALLVIERCFRSLKTTQIHLRPMHHWLPHRIEAHVKICVLALLIQRVAEITCQKSWPWLKHALSQLQAGEFETSSHRFFRRNEPSQDVTDLLQSLSIPMPKPILDLAPVPPRL
jgi:transposase